MLNKPATAREKIRVHLTVFIPADGITCFDGILVYSRIFENLNELSIIYEKRDGPI